MDKEIVMSKPQKKRTKKYHPKNPRIPWALMARMPISENMSPASAPK